MASPFADANDKILNQKLVLQKFKQNHPNESVIYSSTGFIVKRIRKGNRKKLGFPAVGNHHIGGFVLSNKSIFFLNPKKTSYEKYMKLIWRVLLIAIVFAIIPLIIMIVGYPELQFIIPFFSLYLLVGIMLLVLNRNQRKISQLDYSLSEMNKVRINKCKILFFEYDMIDIFDGVRTTHFGSYHDFPEEVIKLVEAMKNGEVISK